MNFKQNEQLAILEHVKKYSYATGFSDANSMIYRIFTTSGEIVQTTGESWPKRFKAVSDELQRMYDEQVAKNRKRQVALDALNGLQAKLDAELAKNKEK